MMMMMMLLMMMMMMMMVMMMMMMLMMMMMTMMLLMMILLFDYTSSSKPNLNMKLVILFALFAVAVAQQATLKSSEARMNPDGSYKYSFELDDGTRVVESGEQKQITVQDAGTVSRGQYTFVADGQRFTVDWVADENGYVATGDHLPRAL